MNEKVENGEDWQEFCAKNLNSLALIFLNRTHREAAVIKISLHSKCFLPSKVFACPWRQEKDSWHKNWYLPHHSLSCKKRNSLNYCFKRYMYQINLTEEDFSAHSWKQQSVPAMAFAYSRHICAYMIFSLILGGRGGEEMHDWGWKQ